MINLSCTSVYSARPSVCQKSQKSSVSFSSGTLKIDDGDPVELYSAKSVEVLETVLENMNKGGFKAGFWPLTAEIRKIATEAGGISYEGIGIPEDNNTIIKKTDNKNFIRISTTGFGDQLGIVIANIKNGIRTVFRIKPTTNKEKELSQKIEEEVSAVTRYFNQQYREIERRIKKEKGKETVAAALAGLKR
jgi:hypothetical protein